MILCASWWLSNVAGIQQAIWQADSWAVWQVDLEADLLFGGPFCWPAERPYGSPLWRDPFATKHASCLTKDFDYCE